MTASTDLAGPTTSLRTMAPDTVLDVRDLRTYIRRRVGEVKAVDGVSFVVKRGETLGVVGESGCGKTITGLSIMRLLPNGGYIAGGDIRVGDVDLATADLDVVRQVRAAKIGMIFQDPMTSLNPTMTIGNQIAESVRQHKNTRPRRRPWSGPPRSSIWSACPGPENGSTTIRTSCRAVCANG